MKLKVGDKLVCEGCGVIGFVEADDNGVPEVNNIGTEKNPYIVCDECYEDYKNTK